MLVKVQLFAKHFVHLKRGYFTHLANCILANLADQGVRDLKDSFHTHRVL